MRITRLRLRNYRVFAGDHELDVPPGLVGIYGPNGAGKSSLVEAIPFALFGSSRTGNDQVRTAGVDEECVVEVELEHEGHLYAVRRRISGINHTVRAQATADGHPVADGTRDTNRYVRSILGIDDAAFRASVFAEQKQLAAFSGTTPAKRRDLVLRLLGITPLDAARDRARGDARHAYADLERLRGLLPPLDSLEEAAAEAEAAASSARVAAGQAARDLAERRRQLGVARRAHEELAVRAAEHDALVGEGREVRRQHDVMERRAGQLATELAGLDDARTRAQALSPDSQGLEAAEARLAALRDLERAGAAVAAATEQLGPPPPAVDEEEVRALQRAAADARAGLLAHRALHDEVGRRRDQVAAASSDVAALTGESDCPLCGQSLGRAFEAVRLHRSRELVDAEARLAELDTKGASLASAAEAAGAAAGAAEARLVEARRARAAWEAASAALAGATAARDEALARLGPPPRDGELATLAAEVERRRRARAEHQRLLGQLERAPRARSELGDLRHDQESLAGRLTTLRDKVRALAFTPGALAGARHAQEEAETAQDEADQRARRAELAATRADAQSEGAAQRLAAALEQHASLADLEDEARHLGRLAELMSDFRNQLVGTVGPRLSRQAASLFAELTDAEYDELRVDPDTYGIEIHDQGVAYELDRFSGSESDLASLALRVAVSEHLCFQSGGQIGVLVLDEVFGPLDAERKDRMLRALERLKGRFRQVLVVTHDDDIKDRLPNAIEVAKLPGRRARASLTHPG
ncbi:MAG TPA: SMC family ATPase [Acidimicrobiales bacterium]|nr:SMC family ATPase [Acidimicrobiales bacterium]